MGRVIAATAATVVWLLLGLNLAVFHLPVVEGRSLSSRRVLGKLPPCSSVWGGIPGWDCYDPPSEPLPPCDFKHQRIGFDCSGWPPAGHATSNSVDAAVAGTESSALGAKVMEACKYTWQLPGTDCWPPVGQSPECDHLHGTGEGCGGSPPSNSLVHLKRDGSVLAELPPCASVPGGIPGWDCYDPPTHPLPPCDFRHQRIGFDCSGWPPAAHVTSNSVDAAMAGTDSSALGAKVMEACKYTWQLPGTDCWPPIGQSPECDHLHGTGEGCGGSPPSNSLVHLKRDGSVLAELPPCASVPGGIPGWDCYDPPTHPLPPCDFRHQRIGFDCSGWPPAAHVTSNSVDAAMAGTDSSALGAKVMEACKYTWQLPGTDCWPPIGQSPECDHLHGTGEGCGGSPPSNSLVHLKRDGSVLAELPPCASVPGGIPGWDCYDPPSEPLPPCDFKHQRIGFDCSGWPPTAP